MGNIGFDFGSDRSLNCMFVVVVGKGLIVECTYLSLKSMETNKQCILLNLSIEYNFVDMIHTYLIVS